ncbi:hypothetical protein PC9H_009240 [Pleurotus ostreatus]|uniref:Fungal-type protein kinase domain-containing protein n=1 Tax=Pleurotus ostreatus TaxID=5322 RepID=A0A8H7DPF8_PLEOS|nr:uncharacterized protein PC9H_009240 [Pleurotus ostreatus]KAF7423942.1 hypothetical protein PC9H_009240 [Pleurotus ostreatus]
MAHITSPRRPLTSAHSFISKPYGSDTVSPDGLVDSLFDISIVQHRCLFDALHNVVAAAAEAPAKKVDHDTHLKQLAKGDSWKVKMYPPLQQVCDHIVDFLYRSEPKATRRIKIAANRRLKGAEYTASFPNVAPDGTGSRVLECASWLDVDWFMEIKPKETQGVAAKDTTIPEVVCQAADYARLHLSCRPFQLFSVGLLIFGRKFMVGIFDRDGVSLSPISDFCDGGEGFKAFIKVIYRLVGPHLSDIDLGHDPTAAPLSPSADLRAALRELAISRQLSPDFPLYLVLCPREHTTKVRGATLTKCVQDTWVTVGPPIWVSLSFIGRGTSIWPVIRVTMESGEWTIANGALVSILKNAWRNSGRTGEAFIYGSLNSPPPGVARFLQGGDVLFDVKTNIPISVHNLRSHYPYDALLHRGEEDAKANAAPAPGTTTTVLHRLILQTIGRPLWHFAPDLLHARLFSVPRSIGHQQLVAHGILHRDISAGNIMISASSNPSAGEDGFLMDLEFASIVEIVHVTSINGVPQRTTWSPPRRGVQMTGTVQFMARDILQSLVNKKPIEHTESHDLESFAWVFAYVVLRRLLRDSGDERKSTLTKDDRLAIKTTYDQSFGALKLDTVLTQRRSLGVFDSRVNRIEGLVPTAIADFMDWLGMMVGANDVGVKPIPLSVAGAVPQRVQKKMSHVDVILIIDATIQSLASEVLIDG